MNFVFNRSELLPFTFAFDAITLAATTGATGTSTRTLDSDAFLIVTEYLYSSTTLTGQASAPQEVTVALQNASNILFQNAPLPNPLWAGPIGADRPEGFLVAFSPREQLTVELTNLAAVARTVTVALKGYKVPLNSPLAAKFGLRLS